MSLRRAHMVSALIIAIFLALHIGNHITLFWGVQSHIDVMTSLRVLYRNMLFESALLAAIFFQILSGATLLWRARKIGKGNKSGAAKLQMISGGYLLLFLMIHVSAVLAGRNTGVDTNIYFAVAGYYNGLAWFFVPYYFLGISAFFAHLGCALYWVFGEDRRPLAIMLVLGISLGAALTVKMAGWLEPIAVPPAYLG